jgi:hypothetical protein
MIKKRLFAPLVEIFGIFCPDREKINKIILIKVFSSCIFTLEDHFI